MSTSRFEHPPGREGAEPDSSLALLMGAALPPGPAPLRDEEATFKKIFNSSSLLLAFTEPHEGRILDVNDAWIRAARIPREEAFAKTGSQLGLWTDLQDRRTILEQLAASGLVEQFPCSLRMGGRSFRALVSVHPVALASGTHLLWEIQDLSELDRLARLAEKREAMFQQVFNCSPAATSLTSIREGTLLQVNEAWCRLFGWSREEVLGRTLADLGLYRNPEDRHGLREDMARHGQVVNWPFLARRKDGGLLHVQVGVSRVQTEDEDCFLAVLHDFSSIHAAEEATRVSEARFRSLIDQSPVAMTVVRGLQVLYVNPTFVAMFGLPDAESIRGRSILDCVAPPSRDAIVERAGRRARKLALESEVETFGLRAGTTTFPIHVVAAEVAFSDGPATVIFVTDLTERIEAEEQRAHLQAQFLQSQKMESLGALAGGVAHDMNNVLAAILALSSAHLQLKSKDSLEYAAFDTISQAAVRGGRLVRSLLDFARVNSAEELELDLNTLLREEVRLLERTTLAKVRINLELEEDLPPVRGDASALTHAFMNLCVNAVDAMPEGGTLTLRTRLWGADEIEVVVADNGAGMPKAVLDRALEPFYTTKAVGKGTGLGLSMVYSTVKAHGGRMELESEPGRGTRVRMFFPVCRTRSLEPVAEPRAQAACRRLSVLVVDDDDLVLSSVKRVVEVLGHATTTAVSGEEALALLAGGLRPDVVILDMNMPGLGGKGTLPRLRALRPDLPVLLATGRADEYAHELAERVPGVTLLSKPFSMGELELLFAAL